MTKILHKLNIGMLAGYQGEGWVSRQGVDSSLNAGRVIENAKTNNYANPPAVPKKAKHLERLTVYIERYGLSEKS